MSTDFARRGVFPLIIDTAFLKNREERLYAHEDEPPQDRILVHPFYNGHYTFVVNIAGA